MGVNFYSRLNKLMSMFQINCVYLHNVHWSGEGMNFRSGDEKNIQCECNHLSSFTMVVLSAEV